MTGKRWGFILLLFVVVLAASYASPRADKNVYLYDPQVAPMIDVDAYLQNGTVQQADGQGFPKYVDRGPAPPEYPTIAISEPGFEWLGVSAASIDGVIFINHGQYLKPNKNALVLWVVRIPNASARSAAEFGQDLTLSMWIDWNQDNVWKESERMTRKSLNVASWFPTSHGDLYVFYLACFDVPDVTMTMESNKKYGGGDSKKEVRHMWARAVVSYDDADNSPDGAQLFGDTEDYRVAYLVKDKNHHNDDDD
jgi:hypothetical protein